MERARTRKPTGPILAVGLVALLLNINDIFARMHKGQIEGRIVLDMAA